MTLTARDRICFNARGGRPCDQETCQYALGYYDRVNDAVDEALALEAATRTAIEEVARRHTVCPFELSLDLSLWADAIICDYNYVFDPKAYLRRYFLDTRGKYLFLIDEAHNLVERARDMYSAELRRSEFRRLKRALGGDHPHLAKALGDIDSCLRGVAERCEQEGDGENWLDREKPEDLPYLLERFNAIVEPLLARNRAAPYGGDLLDCYFTASGFLRVAELFDERYVTCAGLSGRDLSLRLYCIDPSAQIRAALKRGRSAAFFSATLTPLDYFRDLLGGDRHDFTLSLPSPFPREHLALLLADHIDTTWRGRGSSYGDVAESIAAAAMQRRGNYIAYFPSYKYLEEVYGRFPGAPGIRTLVQRRGMSEAEREQFLAVFDSDNRETVVGFAVMGGIFGEGIDLVGERLVGAVIVGVGLPRICLERDLIRGYFDERNLPGFAYAYTYPGMNRVLQAAGRVIRGEADRGLILLVDRRFSQEQYRELFPAHWSRPDRTRGPTASGRLPEASGAGRVEGRSAGHRERLVRTAAASSSSISSVVSQETQGVGDALAVGQLLSRDQVLPAGYEVALDHDPENVSGACRHLGGDLGADDGLPVVVLGAVFRGCSRPSPGRGVPFPAAPLQPLRRTAGRSCRRCWSRAGSGGSGRCRWWRRWRISPAWSPRGSGGRRAPPGSRREPAARCRRCRS